MRARSPVVSSLSAVIAIAAGGCDARERPWSGRDGPAAVLAPPAPGGTGEIVEIDRPATSEATTATATATARGDTDTDTGAPEADPGLLPSPGRPAGSGVASAGAAASIALLPGAEALPEIAPGRAITPGGGWVRCYEGLTLSGDPLKDVTRLGLVCGPSNGLRRKTRQAIVGILAVGEPPVAQQLRVARGACYRVLAVADAGIGELDVTVRSSRDVAVAADHASGRVAIAQPDRPFCTFADDLFSVDFAARRGSGRFAAEVWSLGEPRRRGEPADEPPDERPIDEP